MPLRTIASFAVAIFLGLIAVVLVRGYITHSAKIGSQVLVAGGGAGVPVVVASSPIERGSTLQPAMLKVVSFPAGNVPAGAFTTVAQLIGAGPTARVTLRSIAANEPLLAPRISAPGGKPNLSGALTPGMRAISVRTSDVAGVGGFVLPGDRVDVLVTRSVGNGDSANTVAQVLAQNVRVMGVDQSDNTDSEKPVVAKAVTIEVTPDEAQSISLAQSVGAVTLSLRQSGDETPLAHRSMTVGDLGRFGQPAAAPAQTRKIAAKLPVVASAAPAPAPANQVHITRGVEISAYAVGSD